jgi:hypothetical protein
VDRFGFIWLAWAAIDKFGFHGNGSKLAIAIGAFVNAWACKAGWSPRKRIGIQVAWAAVALSIWYIVAGRN